MKLEPLIAAEAKERQRAGGGSGPSGRQKSVPQKSAEPETRDAMARLAGMSHDTYAKAKAIAAEAKERQREGGKNKVEQKSAQAPRGQKGVQISAHLKGQTRDELATLAGVSHDPVITVLVFRYRVYMPENASTCYYLQFTQNVVYYQ